MRGRTAQTRAVVAAVGLMFLLGACSGSSNDAASTSTDLSKSDQAGAERASSSDSLDAGTAAQAPGSVAGSQSSGLTQTLPIDRDVIATAEVTIRVDDVEAALPDLTHAAESSGGYVSGEDTSSDPDNPSKTRSTMVLRVPTENLQQVIGEISGLGDVLRSQQDVKDVTEQVVDVNSRVKTARASVARIRVLLGQATSLGEVVRIESQLSRREADLEALLATQRSLANQTELATLTVTTLGPEAVQPVTPKDADGFVAGLDRGWNAFMDVVVLALTIIGVLLPFAVAAFLILTPFWVVWRRRQPQYRTVIDRRATATSAHDEVPEQAGATVR
ncbi:MAG TPA: DUF4349 domain-containing protein [Actinomycetes bacterium]|nr:DUF4349 domain-containing protein [Actinomycetes bacterium]